jgi:glycosyltransferase involved in cell wall biosynthesis
MEAQSQGLPVVASRAGAIAELVVDGATGLLVEPDDAKGLAQALARLIGDPQLRHRLGMAGRARVAADFAMAPGIAALAAKFGLDPS